eukprot:529911_1
MEYDIRYQSNQKNVIVDILYKLKLTNERKLVIYETNEKNISNHVVTEAMAQRQSMQQRSNRYHAFIEDAIIEEDEKDIEQVRLYGIKNSNPADPYRLQSYHISNAIKHELYGKIATSFNDIIDEKIAGSQMDVIDVDIDTDRKTEERVAHDNTKNIELDCIMPIEKNTNADNENIDKILTKLQMTNKISQNEINYIGKLVERARQFQPITKDSKINNINHQNNS